MCGGKTSDAKRKEDGDLRAKPELLECRHMNCHR
eukprot:CAMPEP_0174334680 /NCGR_PEP_ID=MMETSP0810-20121108/20134_1 /TAXON_ID=73025 ORGANISM="Eutreptiella gymnastica-like, Strain CCMP1594" /NCGR_SAMPLE_ID=MMETSP0810 /ASSEMBLY_ACC=CAM_ASM_000659 /LENGTH=33 /DNA_ID= /DNA_START= /DNA_END= /DNA_ORIENTATION=